MSMRAVAADRRSSSTMAATTMAAPAPAPAARPSAVPPTTRTAANGAVPTNDAASRPRISGRRASGNSASRPGSRDSSTPSMSRGNTAQPMASNDAPTTTMVRWASRSLICPTPKPFTAPKMPTRPAAAAAMASRRLAWFDALARLVSRRSLRPTNVRTSDGPSQVRGSGAGAVAVVTATGARAGCGRPASRWRPCRWRRRRPARRTRPRGDARRADRRWRPRR